jgi:hypothetical protein
MQQTYLLVAPALQLREDSHQPSLALLPGAPGSKRQPQSLHMEVMQHVSRHLQ